MCFHVKKIVLKAEISQINNKDYLNLGHTKVEPPRKVKCQILVYIQALLLIILKYKKYQSIILFSTLIKKNDNK